MPARDLLIEGARQNNLKNITLALPQDQVVVVTGVSGSGKSSLAFDTLFAEGQWRYIESLSTYARLFLEKIDRPDVDAVRNIRPAIALEQRNSTRGSRATVGTITELYDYFRFLYSAAAVPTCPGCGRDLERWSPTRIVDHLLTRHLEGRAIISFETDPGRLETLRRRGYQRFRQKGVEFEIPGPEPLEVVVDRLILRTDDRPRISDSIETAWREGEASLCVTLMDAPTPYRFSKNLSCIHCGTQVPAPDPNLFSFNHPGGACPECNGFGNILDYDPDRVVPDPSRSLAEGAIEPWFKPSGRRWYKEFLKDCTSAGIDIHRPFADLPEKHRTLIFEGGDGFYSVRDFFEEVESRRYKLHVRVFLSRYRRGRVCGSCGGNRLRPEALLFKLRDRTIVELTAMSIKELDEWQRSLDHLLGSSEKSDEALRLVRAKTSFLKRVGLDYLTMARPAKTLSGGEAQRINLSNQLSARLTGTLYVLDEPTVGLHARDTARISQIVQEISRMGNTMVVVEHDRSFIEAADFVVDMGPGGGHRGGDVVFIGPREAFRQADTLTARYLSGELTGVRRPPKPAAGHTRWLRLSGATGNNLRDITLSIPLGTLTCITGVSGSGKSTLISDTLYPAVARRLKTAFEPAGPFRTLEGCEPLGGIRFIDQSPIGRTPRSNPATYTNVFGAIRKIFASQPEAARLGLGPGHFSFNVPGGRCETCGGEGYQKLEMYFFEDLYVTCDDCKGRRYKPEVLYVHYLGRDIHQVLNMTIDEALVHFSNDAPVLRRLSPLSEMGLGYLKLGQPAPTLSGGEAQRLKICSEVIEAKHGDMLYILDEPTTGLHFDDIRRFMGLLFRLVDEGHTVVVIEHNLDVIRCADWVVDLGPDGGDQGGLIVAEGPPESIASADQSHTGRALRTAL